MAKGKIMSNVYKGCRKSQQNPDGLMCLFQQFRLKVYLTLAAKDSCNQKVI